jgi:hypothetical protein
MVAIITPSFGDDLNKLHEMFAGFFGKGKDSDKNAKDLVPR